MLEAALIRMFLGAQKIGRGINFGVFENSFSGSPIGNSFSEIRSASGGLNIVQPPLKFEIRRAQLVSAGICGLKFRRRQIAENGGEPGVWRNKARHTATKPKKGD